MHRHGQGEIMALEEFCSWQARDFESSEAYLARLDDTAIRELLAAVASLKAQAPGLLRRADVPLGPLTARLAQWRDAVVYGRGFVLIRRLPIERMRESDIALAFAALSAHLGQALPERHDTSHVMRGEDLNLALGSGDGDITGLLCLTEPRAGFDLKLSSAVAVHNAMLHEAPDALAALYERGAAQTAAPAFTRMGQRLFANLRPEAAGSKSRQGRALSDALARAETGALKLDLEPGDILFVNNHHALFGMSRRAPCSLMESDGRLLRLRLESRLVGARPVHRDERAAWPDETAESQAA